MVIPLCYGKILVLRVLLKDIIRNENCSGHAIRKYREAGVPYNRHPRRYSSKYSEAT